MVNPSDFEARSSSDKRTRPLTTAVLGLAIGLGGLGWVGWGLSRMLQQRVSLYWLTDANSDIHYVIEEREVRALSDAQAIAVGLNILIDGHDREQLISAIPPQTELLGAHYEGTAIHLDFSEEFASGGGATSLLGRVTQVLYTATSLAPDSQVIISVEGDPVEVLSGEGLLLEQPLTRASFSPSFKPYIVPSQDLDDRTPSRDTERDAGVNPSFPNPEFFNGENQPLPNTI